MGGNAQSRLNISPKPPTVIMMVGLQGAGKTTSAGKLGLALKKQGKRPVRRGGYLPPGGYHAAAGPRQAARHPRVLDGAGDGRCDDCEEPRSATRSRMPAMSSHIDTAGRLQIDEKLMQELRDIVGGSSA